MADRAHSTPAVERGATTHIYMNNAELRALLRPQRPTHDKDMRPISRKRISVTAILPAVIASAILFGILAGIASPDPVTSGHAFSVEAVR